jgi:hypothetical protein
MLWVYMTSFFFLVFEDIEGVIGALLPLDVNSQITNLFSGVGSLANFVIILDKVLPIHELWSLLMGIGLAVFGFVIMFQLVMFLKQFIPTMGGR